MLRSFDPTSTALEQVTLIASSVVLETSVKVKVIKPGASCWES